MKTDMTDLSPAAQAVSNAAKSSLDWEAGYLPNAVAAAVLRAVASNPEFADVSAWETAAVVRVETILAIAAELEGANG